MEPADVAEGADPVPPAAVDIAAGDTAAADHRVGAVAAALGIADAVVVAEAGMLAVVEGTGPAEHAEWPCQGY